MKNGVAYKNQNVYLKINIYHNQVSPLPSRPVLQLYRNQSTDLWNGMVSIQWQHWIEIS